MASPADNRTKLLACAQRLFAARGYDGVGIQEIVEQAGVTKPTLYHYFGSKQGLLEALLEEGLGPLLEAVGKAAEYHHDLPKTLNEVAQAWFAFARGHRTLLRLHLALGFAPKESEASPAATRIHSRLFAILERLFREAALDHGNMKGRQRAYAETFLGMLGTYAAIELGGHARLDDAGQRQAVHQFMHGIFS